MVAALGLLMGLGDMGSIMPFAPGPTLDVRRTIAERSQPGMQGRRDELACSISVARSP